MGISLSRARYEEIKQIVVDLFVKYDVSCVPVNGFELATKMWALRSSLIQRYQRVNVGYF